MTIIRGSIRNSFVTYIVYTHIYIQDTKAPSTKSTKEPSVKSTKQPSVDSVKSTKQPSVKSTKQPSAKGSKGGKSSTFADSRAGDASSGFMLTDSSNLSLLLACMSGIVGIMVMLA